LGIETHVNKLGLDTRDLIGSFVLPDGEVPKNYRKILFNKNSNFSNTQYFHRRTKTARGSRRSHTHIKNKQLKQILPEI